VGDLTSVKVLEKDADGKTRESRLIARRKTMQDEHGGFQRFLFEWMKWPRMKVATSRPGGSDIYLENLAPLFYIDQDEGWSNIQALQIARYGQQEIGEIAVEYLLGALDAVRARVMRLESEQRARDLKESARLIAEQAMDAMIRRGWRLEWSSHGSLKEIISRWSTRKFREVLQDAAHFDINARLQALRTKSEKLRTALTSQPVDALDTSASIAASQKAISLKEQQHSLNGDLNSLRIQQEQASMLSDSLEHRLLSARDLLRLKRSGVGRLDHLECPFCHRDMDAHVFGLSSQSPESIEANIEALKRDRELIKKNIESLISNIASTTAHISEVDSQLRDAERALITITNAAGPVREQLAATASELSATEREMERLTDASKKIDEIQSSIDRWVADARHLRAALFLPLILPQGKLLSRMR
jgi:DNA repair exonuclease SbcCD ATPase subunit